MAAENGTAIDRRPMWVTTTDLPTAASHPFYRRLNQLLRAHGFDEFVEAPERRLLCGDDGPAGIGAGDLFPGCC